MPSWTERETWSTYWWSMLPTSACAISWMTVSPHPRNPHRLGPGNRVTGPLAWGWCLVSLNGAWRSKGLTAIGLFQILILSKSHRLRQPDESCRRPRYNEQTYAYFHATSILVLLSLFHYTSSIDQSAYRPTTTFGPNSECSFGSCLQ